MCSHFFFYLDLSCSLYPCVHPYIVSYLSDSYLGCTFTFVSFHLVFYLRLGFYLYLLNHLDMMCVYVYIVYMWTLYYFNIKFYTRMYTIVEHAQDLGTEVERARDLRTLGWGCPIFWRQFEVKASNPHTMILLKAISIEMGIESGDIRR